jgi:Fic family protein
MVWMLGRRLSTAREPLQNSSRRLSAQFGRFAALAFFAHGNGRCKQTNGTFAVKASHNHRMESGEKTYIWQQTHWPNLWFDAARLADRLAQVSQAQGFLYGRLADAGWALRGEAHLMSLTQEVLQTSAIEGETLAAHSVRSSLARRLGMDIGALAPVDRDVEGLVDVVLDATVHHGQPLTVARILSWHAALFPTGYSSMSKIAVGQWRTDSQGSMQVVSGAYGKEKVHFQAPPAASLDTQIAQFLYWFNETDVQPVLKAGLAHLWFVTLHPLDDGNGRLSRAIGDLALARADQSPQRFYSLSAQIQKERKDYYEQLERTQKGGLDVTDWLQWFLDCLLRALNNAQGTVDQVMAKGRFWQRLREQHPQAVLNARQIKLINRLLDGFEGKLTSSKWAVIAKCSPDTALRDIQELIALGQLRKLEAGGRSTGYALVWTIDP